MEFSWAKASSYLPHIIIGITVLINVLNAVTKHPASSSGVKKYLGLAVSILSALKSSDVPGNLKIPLVPEKAPEVSK